MNTSNLKKYIIKKFAAIALVTFFCCLQAEAQAELEKAKSEKKQFLIIQKREDVFYFSTLTDATKQIKKLKEEIKKRDKDISFLKSSYKDLKSTSEDEYNTVSSSLYELALHLTKMKNELNKK